MRVNDKKTLPLFTLYRKEFYQKDYWGKHGETTEPNHPRPPKGKTKGVVYHLDMDRGHYSFSDNINEAKKLYKWLASNSIVEWAMLINKQGKAWIGTVHNESMAPLPGNLPWSAFEFNRDRKKYYETTKWGRELLRWHGNLFSILDNPPKLQTIIGFEIDNLVEDWHSHYGTEDHDLNPSSGDLKGARSAKAKGYNIKHIMYSPLKSGNKEIDYTDM